MGLSDDQEAIGQVVAGTDLSEAGDGPGYGGDHERRSHSAQIGAFITALRIKGETMDEITGAVRVMRDKATFIDTGVDTAAGQVLMDTCGTGGRCSGTFNVSTTTSLCRGRRPGCRWPSTATAPFPHMRQCRCPRGPWRRPDPAAGADRPLRPQVGIGFLFAPLLLHGAMKHAIGPRREIGIRTIFNILGPMTNPAGANVQVLGVFSAELTETLARVLGQLGSKRALVVHGEGNLDELTVTGATRISELADGKVSTYSVTPEEFGLKRSRLNELAGAATPQEAAVEMRAILAGEPGPKRDMVLLNSGAALMAAGLSGTIAEGIRNASGIIDSGKALAKLDDLIQLCTSLRQQNA
jgi:anthranilate phosphoribosyltransferase